MPRKKSWHISGDELATIKENIGLNHGKIQILGPSLYDA